MRAVGALCGLSVIGWHTCAYSVGGRSGTLLARELIRQARFPSHRWPHAGSGEGALADFKPMTNYRAKRQVQCAERAHAA